ncbi:MAG: nucleotidyltransferase domain-containing protein [Candidatus Omnitrophica bacterium]|nr:nucleotidyltransferase domain-containing protein [Candidatus Omnitrophota bacterium]
MLKNIFIRTVEQRVLSLFVANQDKVFYSREVSRKLKISIGAISNALRLLEKNNVLISEKKGKTNLYTLKLPNEYLERFKILNTLLTLEPLVEKLNNISRRTILYGSYAAGTFTPDSDLDLFIISEKRDEVLKAVSNFKANTAFEIKPVIKKQIEWMQLEKSNPEFFAEVNRGIILWEKPINESGF